MSQPVIRILVVDDESTGRRALSSTLLRRGFLVAEASRGEDALKLLRAESFDAVLLDVKMPGIGGIETLRRIRSFAPKLPILIFTDRDKEAEKVEAFDLGADDYITKPFSRLDLVARIRARVRRVREPDEVKESTIEIGDIRLEPASHTVTIRGVPVRLTPKEFDILRYLMNRANQVVTYDKLLTQLWGADHSAQIENLRTFIRQLRVKIEDDPSNPFYLLTDAHIGYRFADVLKLGSHRQIRT